ncbi:MFS transporter [Anaerobium acetethylicum]|uniref:MFS transporter, DHA3 family, macrolide efflux protein n=1 Tax=Anaerobium acetethylicum TaxID=1619234 RepID=A0A1D3TU21_9FIRM|nr:MFS transporter [Anaerobium acetethylicum]SCP97477.1 MFS transporter, DHA3 family, macrolide efflux protein [Anaerobium acetethylicum]
MNRQKQEWKRRFYILWTGQAVSILTSSVIQMAIIWYMTEKTGSAAILSFATMAGFLPHAVLGPFIGVLVDRYDRKKIMIISDLLIAAVTLILVVWGFYTEIPIWLIMSVLFVRSIGTTFHMPSLQAVTPLIVPGEHLVKYAGYSQAVESVSMLLSPAIAAALYGVWDISTIILLDVAGAVFAAVTITSIEIPALVRDEEAQTPHMIREAKEAVAVIRKEQGMIALLFISALYAIIYMPIGTLYPLMCISYFGSTFTEAGIVEILFASGTLIGSIALGRWGEKIDKIGAIKKSIGVMGIGLLISGLLPSGVIWIFGGLAAVMGVTIPFYYGVLTTIFQLKIEPEYLGRVFSLSMSLSMVAMPVGLLLSAAFVDVIGVNIWFLISGVLAILLAFVCAMLPSLRKCCTE